jgi:hypothetical protein
MKKHLLAATAIAALAFAGAANASTLTFRTATGSQIGSIEAAGGLTTGYDIAAESSSITSVPGDFALNLDLSDTSTLPSTGVTLVISLTGNAQFGGTGISSSDITAGAGGCTTLTVVPVSGGGATESSATFLVSNSASDCQSINIDLPVTLTSAAAGTVGVSTSLSVGGTLIDPPQASITPLINIANAFSASIVADTPSGTSTDTVIEGSAYTSFVTGGTFDTLLGTVTVARAPQSFLNLDPANETEDTDITDVNVSVSCPISGCFSTVDLVAGGTLAATETQGTGDAAAVANSDAAGVGTIDLSLAAATGAIPPSSYTATVTTTLDATDYSGAAPTATGALQQTRREGVTVLVPWTSSGSRAQATGTRHNVRISNNGSADAAVYAEVLNTRGAVAGYVAPGLVQLGTIAQGTSANFDSGAMQSALGDFGQGDIRITVDSSAESITIKRQTQDANGSVSELSLGHAAFDVTNSN